MKKLFSALCLMLATTGVFASDYDTYYQDLPCQVKPVVPIQIPDHQVSITECGAVGDGVTLCTEAIEKAISKVTKLGGGRVVIPEGVWLTGPIMLKDNIELRVEQGAIVCFSPDKQLFLDKNPDAKRFDVISIDEVVERGLQAVDMTASILAKENHMPMRVFALQEENSIVKAASGDFNGTTITV